MTLRSGKATAVTDALVLLSQDAWQRMHTGAGTGMRGTTTGRCSPSARQHPSVRRQHIRRAPEVAARRTTRGGGGGAPVRCRASWPPWRLSSLSAGCFQQISTSLPGWCVLAHVPRTGPSDACSVPVPFCANMSAYVRREYRAGSSLRYSIL